MSTPYRFRRAQFHPQRLYPRFASSFAAAARLPGGVAGLAAVSGWLSMDPMPSDTENPTTLDLDDASAAVCGFPRTGTTFLQLALATALGCPRACWKTHDILSVPLLTDAGLPVAITVRDPESTLCSWAIYHHDEPSERLMLHRAQAYVAWHRQALRYVDKGLAVVADFTAFTDDPTDVVDAFLPDVVSHGRPAALDPDVVARALRAQNHRSGLPVTRHNVPAEERGGLRPAYEGLLSSRRLSRVMGEATELHARLTLRGIASGAFDEVAQ